MQSVKVMDMNVQIQNVELDGNLGEYWASPFPTIKKSSKVKDNYICGKIILHEILHHISYECELKLTERQVKCLENYLAATIRDNPKFVRLLKS